MEFISLRKCLLTVGILALFQTVKADDIIMATPEQSEPVEHAVVELHITQRDFPGTETKSHKKTLPLAGHSICSGAFIDNTGDIITAGHCAAEAANIEVVTYDQRHYKAVVVATSSIHDLALIHIDRLNTAFFRPAPKVERGEKVFILGSPLGITDSLSTGIIAKLDGDIILVDCGALPGNSGSAVYNVDGQLVGVLTAGYWVGFGTTHLNISQSVDAVYFFLVRAFRGIRQ